MANLATIVGPGGSVNFAASSSLALNIVDLFSYSANLTNSPNGSLGLLKFGSGTLQLDQASITGPTTIVAGVLTTSNTALQSSNVTVNGGLVFDSGAGTYSLGARGQWFTDLGQHGGHADHVESGANGATTTFSGAMSGSGGLILTGGNLTLSGTNVSITGNTTVSSGTLLMYNARNFSNGLTSLNSAANTITIGSGSLFEMYVDNTSGTSAMATIRSWATRAAPPSPATAYS